MAFVIADRVRETTTTTGTGSVTLGGAYTSFQTFSAAIGNANNTYYTIASATSGEWEVGIGTYSSSGNLLSRDTVLSSSNGGSLVSFTSGTKDVFVTQPANRAIFVQNAGTGLQTGTTAFTASRVLYANATSTITTSSNLTFDGTTLVAANFTDSSLTSGRVTYAGAGGNLTDSANLTFDGTTLTANALTTTSTVTINGGTANGVAYLNGSKVLTTGSALTFDGTRLGVGGNPASTGLDTGATQAFIVAPNSNTGAAATFIADSVGRGVLVADQAKTTIASIAVGSSVVGIGSNSNTPVVFNVNASEQMRLTSTGLGIGTSSPAEKLQVVGKILSTGDGRIGVKKAGSDSVGSGPFFSLQNADASREWFNQLGASNSLDWWFYNGSSYTKYATLDTSGNLGLGVTPSAWDADFKAIQVQRAAVSSYLNLIAIFSQNNYADKYIASGIAASKYQQNAGSHAFFTAPSGTAGNAITFTQAMTLDASGNWMVGGTTAIGRATVVGGTSQLAFHDGNGSNTNYGLLNYGGSSGELTLNANSTGGNTLIRFLTSNSGSNAERARIDSSGNLLVGTTSSSGKLTVTRSTDGTIGYFDGTTTQFRIDVASSTINLNAQNGNAVMAFQTNGTERARITSGGYFKASNSGTYAGSTASYHELYSNASGDWIGYFTQATATNPNGVVIQYTAAAPNGTGNTFLYCQDNAAVRATIRSNGGLANYSANDVNLSDRREKINFAPAKSYLDTICAIPVQTFNYVDQNLDDDPGLTLGVVAQDVQAVAPELVMESNWGTEDTPKMRLSVYQTDLQYALMKALQELKSELDSVKAELATLKGA